MTEAGEYIKIGGAQKPRLIIRKAFLDEKGKMLFQMLCISKN